MATTNVYLTFKGNCEAAFTFYKKAFGGEFTYLGRFGEMPADENCSVSESDKNLIMHVSLPIGSTVLMGSDVGEPWSKSFVIGNNFSVSVSAESKRKPIDCSVNCLWVDKLPCLWAILLGRLFWYVCRSVRCAMDDFL
jgi:PhnB protein